MDSRPGHKRPNGQPRSQVGLQSVDLFFGHVGSHSGPQKGLVETTLA